ncbi:ATP-binding protein, partial [Patescibacteria group bacterium]|nr:hypothetical protein [Desulfobacteraceae bacterium]MBU4103434.1 ATP-binding protein [Patescibacteria group bacterium]
MINQQTARAILTNLSSGTVSIKYSDYYNVGRQNQLQIIKNEIEDKSGKLRFINGDYGTGKTHFLSTIRNWALKNGYVPSHVVLSPRGTPLYDLESVYSRIIKSLIIDDNEFSSPIETLLEYVFQEFKNWLSLYIQGEVRRCSKTLMNPLYCQHCNMKGVIEELYIENFKEIDRKLQIAIIIYRYARWGYHPDYETADLVIRWLEGETLFRRDLNYLGIWEHVTENDILRGLNEIAKLISLLKKQGLIIMLDEAEGIENLTPHQRPIAYENLKFLIEGINHINNVYFLYATTPTFYQEIYTQSDYLSDLVKKTSCTDLIPLSNVELEKLAHNIINIFEIAAEDNFKYDIQNVKKHINYAYNKKISVRDFIT